MTQHIRADKLLANLGYGSRKDVTRLIRAGALTVAGQVVDRADRRISLDAVRAHGAQIDGQPLDPLSPLMIMLHKPAGYVCSRDDGDGASIFELLPFRFHVRTPALAPAGRLDKDSTGLVFLTDDGDLMHRIISPKTHLPKVYTVRVADPFRGDEAQIFGAGDMMLKSEQKPLLPVVFTPTGDCTAQMVLREGRYHQIRRMFGAIGNKVEALARVHIGPLTLEGLSPGDWRFLRDDERDAMAGALKGELDGCSV